jgi:hypothetical protein
MAPERARSLLLLFVPTLCPCPDTWLLASGDHFQVAPPPPSPLLAGRRGLLPLVACGSERASPRLYSRLQWRGLGRELPLPSPRCSSSPPSSSSATAALPGAAAGAGEALCTRPPWCTRTTPARSPGIPGKANFSYPFSQPRRRLVSALPRSRFESSEIIGRLMPSAPCRRAFLYPHFLSDDEANHLVSLVSASAAPVPV